MTRLLRATLPCFAFSFTLCFSQTKFYNYYDNGLEFMDKGDWQRAIAEFKSAASLEFEDSKVQRADGVRPIKYFPHREMGIAFYNLSEFDNAKKELELSLAYVESPRAEEYIELVKRNVPPSLATETKTRMDEDAKKRDRELAEAEERKRELEKAEKEKRKGEESDKTPAVESSKDNSVPVVALTYDPLTLTQVGSRLGIVVLPLKGKEGGDKYADAATERLISQLVNLQRFRVIERSSLDEVLKEQKIQASGVVDEKTVVKIGKVTGADAIIFGSISLIGSTADINARAVDTQTSETIVAKGDRKEAVDLDGIERLVETVAILICNELPIIEASIVTKDNDIMYIDAGYQKGIRKNSKCVAFREGEDILHPKTKEVLGKKRIELGQLQVVDVQQKTAQVRVVSMEPGRDIEIGDKIVVK